MGVEFALYLIFGAIVGGALLWLRESRATRRATNELREATLVLSDTLSTLIDLRYHPDINIPLKDREDLGV